MIPTFHRTSNRKTFVGPDVGQLCVFSDKRVKRSQHFGPTDLDQPGILGPVHMGLGIPCRCDTPS